MNPPATISCRVCGATTGTASFEARERMFGLDASALYHTCPVCRSLSITEIPGNLGALYPKDYYAHAAESSPPGLRQRLLGRLTGTRSGALRATLRAQPSRDAAILDVGCGRGELLGQLADRGFINLLGADPFLDADSSDPRGFKLLRRELHQVEGTFDLITFHHVLEHVPDPGSALNAARERLRPGGRILVRIPLADSLAFRKFGPLWVQLDAPRHLNLPTRAGLAACAAKAGFRISSAWFDSTSLQFWGSRRYAEGRTMMRSGTIAAGRSPFGKLLLFAQICEDALRAALLNRTGGADQGCFLLNLAPKS